MDLTGLSLLRNPGAPQRPRDGVVRLVLPQDSDDHPDLLDRDGAPLDALASTTRPPQTPGEALLVLLVELDAWLAPYADRPPASAFAAWRHQALEARPQIERQVLDAARPLLGRQIVDAVPDWSTVRRLTRLVLLLDLLDPRTTPDTALKAAGQATDLVFSRLRRRTPLFPAGVDVDVPDPKVKLVRDAKVSDLFVVRSEWSCYLRGEIASITNVLAGESFSRTVTLTDEQETTVTRETERTELTEVTEEDRSQTEIAREVNREQALQVHAEGSINVSGKYGLTNFAASAGAGVNASLSESSRQASRIAREVLSKAVTKVENRVREERVQRTLTRSIQNTRHAIENDTSAHVRGVYRWVDRIDRYQLFRYPDRLQLEFEIPEPAEYLRYRLDNKAKPPPAGGVDKPPAFTVSANTIDPSNYAAHALTYRAGNLPPPPDPSISVSVAASLTPTGEQEKIKNRDEQWTAPQLEKQFDVTIPRSYTARSVDVAATAMPKRANWRVEWQPAPPSNGKFGIEGFHQITLTVAAGGGRLVHQKGAAEGFERFTVQMSPQLGSEDRPSTYFGDAYLAIPIPADSSSSITFAQPVADKVSLAVSLAGASSAAVSAEVKCQLRPEALAEWQNSVYDLLLDSWRAWDREWRLQEQGTLGPQLSAVDARSPARNLQIIVEELKRQVIAWLLDDESFAGRDAMLPPGDPPPPWQRYSIAKARDAAPVIQFLEQGLEWGNLTYVPYPYYWARGSEWDDLSGIEAADPTFGAFLRAGSVRVVVPARPGFELAILHWLVYQEPFFGDPMPLPDKDLYVSVATEIRDLTRPPEDGDPGDCWETRLPTTLMWLDGEATLPRNEARRLGRPPHTVKDPYCDLGTDPGDESDDDEEDEEGDR
jgi:hypothetical protein